MSSPPEFSAYSGASFAKPSGTTTLAEVAERVRGAELAAQTTHVRSLLPAADAAAGRKAAADTALNALREIEGIDAAVIAAAEQERDEAGKPDAELKAAKAALPKVNPAAVVGAHRDEDGIKSYSGYLCIDLDKTPDGVRLSPDHAAALRDGVAGKGAALAAVSASGRGVWAVFRLDPVPADRAEFKEAYLRVAGKVSRAFSVPFDRAATSPVSLRYLAHDPDVRYTDTERALNWRAASYDPPVEESPPPPPEDGQRKPARSHLDRRGKPDGGYTVDDLTAALRSIKVGPSYDPWWKVVVAGKRGGIPYEVVRDWSANQPAFDQQSFDSIWNAPSADSGDISAGTLVGMAREHGWVSERETEWQRARICPSCGGPKHSEYETCRDCAPKRGKRGRRAARPVQATVPQEHPSYAETLARIREGNAATPARPAAARSGAPPSIPPPTDDDAPPDAYPQQAHTPATGAPTPPQPATPSTESPPPNSAATGAETGCRWYLSATAAFCGAEPIGLDSFGTRACVDHLILAAEELASAQPTPDDAALLAGYESGCADCGQEAAYLDPSTLLFYCDEHIPALAA